MIFRAVILAVMVACTAFSMAGAQSQTSAEEQSKQTGQGTKINNPSISYDILANLLIPLTRPELEAVSKDWLSIVGQETQKVADLQISFLGREVQASEYQSLAQLVEKRAGLFQKFTMVVDSLEKKGGDPDLVKELRAYRDAVISDETSLASSKALFFAAVEWLTRKDGGLKIAGLALVLVISLGVLLLIARLVRGIARRWIGKMGQISNLLQEFCVAAVYWLFLAIGLLFVLSAMGVNITPLYAMIGGASFILAFAFQDTLSNLANGLMIMINKPFDSGDYVDVGGVSGTVSSVSIVATKIVTPDNQIIMIPNKNVWGNTITNVTASETRRVDLLFGISYEDEIPKALEVIENTVRSHAKTLQEPEPLIRVHELADNSVNIICRPWTKTEDYWTVYWDLNHHMKEAFDKAEISIPYPQRDVHLKST